MRVDLPAPFSPMRVWISPPCSVKSTLSRAFTPGNSMVIPRISTIGGTAASSAMEASLGWNRWGPVGPAPSGGVQGDCGSVLAVRQRFLRLLLSEGLVGDDGL